MQGPWFAAGCPCSRGCYVCGRGSFTIKFRHLQDTDWCSWEALGVLGRLQHHRGMQLSEAHQVFRIRLRMRIRNCGEVEVGCDHFVNGRSLMDLASIQLLHCVEDGRVNQMSKFMYGG